METKHFNRKAHPRVILFVAFLVLAFGHQRTSFAMPKTKSLGCSLNTASLKNKLQLRDHEIDSLEKTHKHPIDRKVQIQPGPNSFADRIHKRLKADQFIRQDTLIGSHYLIGLSDQRAKNINLAIIDFELPVGAKIWVYNPSCTRIEGPYSRASFHQRELWMPIILGSTVVLEIFVPQDVKLKLPEHIYMNSGYLDVNASLNGACNKDVRCKYGSTWPNQIRSVAMYTIGGRQTCTGQLLNNTAEDFTPYFLTAAHCEITDENDQTLVFYWNYQAAKCDDRTSQNFEDNQIGATILATNSETDFLLLQLKNIPDTQYNVYFAGWDASGSKAVELGTIHHPQGAVKSISLSNGPIMSTGYYSDVEDKTSKFWRVPGWNVGTTEPGSSGACLWDSSSRLCIGQLHSGYSSCNAPNKPDWYGKLSESWDSGKSPRTNLRPWLDPENTGKLKMQGASAPRPPQ